MTDYQKYHQSLIESSEKIQQVFRDWQVETVKNVFANQQVTDALNNFYSAVDANLKFTKEFFENLNKTAK